MKTTTAQKKMLTAAANGSVCIGSMANGNTFASLARAGLMTHSANGAPEPGFDAFVIGSIVYITPAGKAVVS